MGLKKSSKVVMYISRIEVDCLKKFPLKIFAKITKMFWIFQIFHIKCRIHVLWISDSRFIFLVKFPIIWNVALYIFFNRQNFYFLCHGYKESKGGLNYENLVFWWKYIVKLIKWLEILSGLWVVIQNFKIDESLRSICKYRRYLILTIDFCKRFQENFVFQG